jgi:hypothetical protein
MSFHLVILVAPRHQALCFFSTLRTVVCRSTATSVAHVLDVVGGAKGCVRPDLGPWHALCSAAVLDLGGLETQESELITQGVRSSISDGSLFCGTRSVCGCDARRRRRCSRAGAVGVWCATRQVRHVACAWSPRRVGRWIHSEIAGWQVGCPIPLACDLTKDLNQGWCRQRIIAAGLVRHPHLAVDVQATCEQSRHPRLVDVVPWCHSFQHGLFRDQCPMMLLKACRKGVGGPQMDAPKGMQVLDTAAQLSCSSGDANVVTGIEHCRSIGCTWCGHAAEHHIGNSIQSLGVFGLSCWHPSQSKDMEAKG